MDRLRGRKLARRELLGKVTLAVRMQRMPLAKPLGVAVVHRQSGQTATHLPHRAEPVVRVPHLQSLVCRLHTLAAAGGLAALLALAIASLAELAVLAAAVRPATSTMGLARSVSAELMELRILAVAVAVAGGTMILLDQLGTAAVAQAAAVSWS